MADNKQPTPAPPAAPDCVTEIRMGQFRPCRVRLFQERHYHHRRRQNGAGTGSGSRCYTKTGDLTSCKEADLTLLPLYNQPCSVVQ